jgi:hypothetical protein
MEQYKNEHLNARSRAFNPSFQSWHEVAGIGNARDAREGVFPPTHCFGGVGGAGACISGSLIHTNHDELGE